MAVLPTPQGLCVMSTYQGLCLRLNWSPVDGNQDGLITSPLDGISGFAIYRALSQLTPYTRIAASVQGLTFFYTPPGSVGWRLSEVVNNNWWFRVSAVGALGESDLSAPRTVRPYWSFNEPPVDGLCVGGLI